MKVAISPMDKNLWRDIQHPHCCLKDDQVLNCFTFSCDSVFISIYKHLRIRRKWNLTIIKRNIIMFGYVCTVRVCLDIVIPKAAKLLWSSIGMWRVSYFHTFWLSQWIVISRCVSKPNIWTYHNISILVKISECFGTVISCFGKSCFETLNINVLVQGFKTWYIHAINLLPQSLRWPGYTNSPLFTL